MGPTGCSEPGCDHQHYARSLCNRHYKLFRAHGTIDTHPHAKAAPGMTLDQRLRNIGWDVSPTGCWIWRGAKTTAGYGLWPSG